MALVETFTRDVEVTRRLYRSGESEYLIDGEVCRLRDVHELLMDTGLGAKAYAIIEQGKIGMILSSRPADRRQLIEEAAGITKYKSRRRAAELKLEAAQQNLTRIDDIVFEVEKQRGALKRQAAKARRYKRLRDELRRWEKVLFARRYRELAAAIDGARARLAEAREREAAAAGARRRGRGRSGAAADRAGRSRQRAAAAFARTLTRASWTSTAASSSRSSTAQQAEMLARAATRSAEEIDELEARREPARLAIEARRQALRDAERARDEAEAVRLAAAEEHARAQQQIEGLEADVEAARAEVFAARERGHRASPRHAARRGAARARRRDARRSSTSRPTSERRESAKADADRRTAAEALDAARGSWRRSSLSVPRASRSLTALRGRAREPCARDSDARAGAGRRRGAAGVARGARGQPRGVRRRGADGARAGQRHVGQQGAVADYLDVDGRYERAVEACLGELLQHVIVERHDQAAAGLSLVREQDAGRCGFVVIDPGSNGYHPRDALRMPGIVPVSDVLRVSGPACADDSEGAARGVRRRDVRAGAWPVARQTSAAVATLEGDVLRGPHLVSGGAKAESRGILATRREIKELRERIAADRDGARRLPSKTSARLEAIDRRDGGGRRSASATSSIGSRSRSSATRRSWRARKTKWRGSAARRR